MSKIIWTKIDEAPALATYSLLPIVNAFTQAGGVDVVLSDISLANRVLSSMAKATDELSKLGEVVLQPEGNIIKLPNVSASVGQLIDCITELQAQGYDIPSYPEDASSDEDKEIQAKYGVCLGSAVNPVLREGNSDRRAAVAVKNFAQKNPHKLRAFESPSKAYVAHMEGNGDFFANEQSVTLSSVAPVTIELNGEVLRELSDMQDKEVIDGTFMSVSALRAFLQDTIDEAKKNDVLWSLHLKATMMKISDPIMFGHATEVFFKDVFDKYQDEFDKLGYNSNMGLGDLYKKLEKSDKKDEIEAAIAAVYPTQPNMAMVDSDKGITNLHASNDIIIDASMPVVVRDGGKMWNADGKPQECVSVIPDSTYAMFHQAMVDDCVENGQYDVATMGNVSNVGLMAQKAEEYGSHPNTIEIPTAGTVEVKQDGNVLMSFDVEAGDIWRLSRTKDIPIADWVRLAVERGRLTGDPVVFWLNEKRAHDAQILTRVNEYLPSHDTDGLDISIMNVADATKFSNARMREGKNTIAATGNVLRDHLTDMYPILELGTSAKMLSIVPLINGGGLFETGAGGSAPKHVEQFVEEGHLRWDSLGEFLALAESLRFIGNKNPDAKLTAVTAALDTANQAYLDNNKSPSRKCGEPDNRASHFFLAQYWAKALAEGSDEELASKFAPASKALTENEDKIISEFLATAGSAKDIGGYFKPDDAKAEVAMRPSATLNAIIDAI